MSMAMKYAMQKRMAKGGAMKCAHGGGADCPQCYAEGGEAKKDSPLDDKYWDGSFKLPHHTHRKKVEAEALAKQKAREDEKMAASKRRMDPVYKAEGGDVEDDDMISRIMHEHFASPGAEANEAEPVADFEDNQFDDLVKEGGMEGDYVGDENLGNEQLDEDEDDVVKRAMRSWAKKDRMPRPA